MRDIFPARVVTPEGSFPKARVLLDENRVRVYVAKGPEVTLAVDRAASGFVRDRGRFVVTVDGFQWFVTEDRGGCGCKRKGPLREVSLEALDAMTLEAV